MNRSMGVLAQAVSFTRGGAGFRSGWKDQNFRCSGRIVNLGDGAGAAVGAGLVSSVGQNAAIV